VGGAEMDLGREAMEVAEMAVAASAAAKVEEARAVAA
jgi:hypothetical protein